ncbi:hypothetical protein JR316_0011002 [Psilocybe cubensis]|uniref:F-box domain-containing protein n=2 Tax=Psilocybe cubensis TaxID=181762 RepID=A0A8H8CF91_PSICU|nr:hypothetical protein JR316_0011002 [Psilocybe cubensis]KAH9477086.1 hypothetical protein JR316_0011002 [Psilocybe cubensis]
MTEKNLPQLPYEIYGLILYFCDKPNLKKASLVNRSFYEISHLYLFRSMLVGERITVRDSVKDASEFLKPTKILSLIEAHPNIAKYVRSLTIDCSREYHNECWITDDTTMQDLLPRFEELEEITIYAQTMTLWESLPSNFQHALKTVFRKSQLHTFHIHGILGFPLEVVSASRIRHLSYNVGAPRSDGTSTLPPHPLESLILGRLYYFDLPQFQTIFSLDHLVELHLTIQCSADIGKFDPILGLSAASLEVLTIRALLNFDPVEIAYEHIGRVLNAHQNVPCINLGQLQKLRRLIFCADLHITCSREAMLYICRIPWMIGCLETLSTSSVGSLSEVTFNVRPVGLGLERDSRYFYFNYPWQDLADTLLSSNLATVKKVNLTINNAAIQSHREQFMDILRRDLHLARLRDAGILSIDAVQDWEY